MRPPEIKQIPALHPPALRPPEVRRPAGSRSVPAGDTQLPLPVSAERVSLDDNPRQVSTGSGTATAAIDFRVIDAIRSSVGPNFARVTGMELSRLPFVARAAARLLPQVPALNANHHDVHLALATRRSQLDQTDWPVIAHAQQKRAGLIGLEGHFPGIPEAQPTFVIAEVPTRVNPEQLATLTINHGAAPPQGGELVLTFAATSVSGQEANLFLSLMQTALHSADWHGEF